MVSAPVTAVVSTITGAGAAIACPSTVGPAYAGAACTGVQDSVATSVQNQYNDLLDLGGHRGSLGWRAGQIIGAVGIPGTTGLSRAAAARAAARRAAEATARRTATQAADRIAANAGSRLAEASSAAFRAADNVGDFTVSAKHLPGAGGRWNKWAEGVDINGTIASALRSDGATFLPNPGGAADSFIVRTNAGRVIGTKGQTFVKAVISNGGRIITAYPVK